MGGRLDEGLDDGCHVGRHTGHAGLKLFDEGAALKFCSSGLQEGEDAIRDHP
jgi:hypothetical protein